MWTCPKCGEQIEDPSDSCPKCAAQPEQIARPARKYLRWLLLFVCGVFFEILLFVLGNVPPENRLMFKAHSLINAIHTPLFWLMAAPLDQSFFLVLFLMGLFWAILLYCGLSLVKWCFPRVKISARQKLVLGFGFGCACLAAVAWAIVAAQPEAPVPFTASPEVTSAVDGNTAFALDLYQKLKQRPGNLFFSPYSISTALAMTYAGARGSTGSEMAKVLHFGLPQKDLHPAFGALAGRMRKIQRPNLVTLLTANSLWCQRDHRFTDGFLDVVHANYQAEAQQVDFIHAPSAASGEINQWVASQTKGKIKDVVASGQFARETRLVLCNAIYFKGKWSQPFKVSHTQPDSFHISTNQTVTVPMMFQEDDFKTTRVENELMQLLELPYRGDDLSMIILLPASAGKWRNGGYRDLSELEPKLTAENLHAWLAKLDGSSLKETAVRLPRFTTAQNMDLEQELKSMGMPSAFDADANFSAMDGTTNLYLSDVLHKAWVEVNETGSEAAAATSAEMSLKADPECFIADHPFIFLIRDNGSGTILFLGRIVDPRK
jgi:serpin B